MLDIKNITLTSPRFPTKEELVQNQINYPKEVSSVDLRKATEALRGYTTEDIYEEWMSILDNRNNSYGINTWFVLGPRFLYGMLFVKYLRYVESRSFDSMVDTFGYCVLMMNYCMMTDYYGNLINKFAHHEIPESVHSIFERHYDSLWNDSEASYLDILDFTFSLVMSMTLEYLDDEGKTGVYF